MYILHKIVQSIQLQFYNILGLLKLALLAKERMAMHCVGSKLIEIHTPTSGVSA